MPNCRENSGFWYVSLDPTSVNDYIHKVNEGRLTQAVNGEGGIAGDSVSNHFFSYILKVMPI